MPWCDTCDRMVADDELTDTGTCPICEALAAGKEPTCVFVQPAPGAHQTYLSSGERLHRRLADLALHLPGRLNPYRVR